MDPKTALMHHSKYLLEFEKTEILDFEEIFFFNTKALPIEADDVLLEASNFGFDNDKNEYITKVGQHIAYRYEIQGDLGKGSFGCVYKCFDHKTKQLVALKILRNKKRLYQ
jgi:dual specificity tyrosine-phosphorylation-regulated kinase 2/3/4